MNRSHEAIEYKVAYNLTKGFFNLLNSEIADMEDDAKHAKTKEQAVEYMRNYGLHFRVLIAKHEEKMSQGLVKAIQKDIDQMEAEQELYETADRIMEDLGNGVGK